MSAIPASAARKRTFAVTAKRWAYWFSRHWLFVANLFFGLYVGLPWLAPVLMNLGWTDAGRVIYAFYSTQCHQLPERSYFVFGPKVMYSLSEIQAAWKVTDNPMILRQFVGNAALGWKVAWSDRMVSLYTGIFLSGLVFGVFRKRLRPLPLWAFALLALPMALDGGTHFLSDFAGIGQGFRDSNAWLAALTDPAFPSTFYAGDALGSFNSWLRLITGILFAVGGVGVVYPYLESAFADMAHSIEAKLRRAALTP